MAQLRLYISDALATELKMKARQRGVSISRYAAAVLSGDPAPEAWPKGYFEKRCGFLRERMTPPADPAAEPVCL